MAISQKTNAAYGGGYVSSTGSTLAPKTTKAIDWTQATKPEEEEGGSGGGSGGGGGWMGMPTQQPTINFNDPWGTGNIFSPNGGSQSLNNQPSTSNQRITDIYGNVFGNPNYIPSPGFTNIQQPTASNQTLQDTNGNIVNEMDNSYNGTIKPPVDWAKPVAPSGNDNQIYANAWSPQAVQQMGNSFSWGKPANAVAPDFVDRLTTQLPTTRETIGNNKNLIGGYDYNLAGYGASPDTMWAQVLRQDEMDAAALARYKEQQAMKARGMGRVAELPKPKPVNQEPKKQSWGGYGGGGGGYSKSSGSGQSWQDFLGNMNWKI